MTLKRKKSAVRRRRRTKITGFTPAGPNHAVLSVLSEGGPFLFRREVCEECPWRTDRPVGVFPAEAYRHSARTCYDVAQTTFACHMAGPGRSQTCAGFLLSSSAEHNLAIRMKIALRKFGWDMLKATVPTYPTYRSMAEANGVDPADPVLAPCR